MEAFMKENGSMIRNQESFAENLIQVKTIFILAHFMIIKNQEKVNYLTQ